MWCNLINVTFVHCTTCYNWLNNWTYTSLDNRKNTTFKWLTAKQWQGLLLRCEIYTLSKQDGTQETELLQPAYDDKEAWYVYWKFLGQSWRIELISKERQSILLNDVKLNPTS